MSDVATMRPGVVVGAYPEREDDREGALDRVAGRLVGAVRQMARPHGRESRFVARVHEAADALALLTEMELVAAVAEIRAALHAEGLTEPLCARAFAAIREYAGRRLDMRHYDVQLAGGWVMLKGLVAEMETGEGKTLTATLPAATAALAGVPVHIVTVNDFLVERDAQWMRPLYDALGLTVGTITEGLSQEARRAAYACDVVYASNKQIVFDYLRDRLVLEQEARPLHLKVEGLWRARARTSELIMRGLCFAIVDEADSVLVDEARTPLIISRRADSAEEERTYRQAVAAAGRMRAPRDFAVRDRSVDLTDLGRAHARRLTARHGGAFASSKHREELVRQALAAVHLYQRDKHYILSDGRVQIVDEYTGRVMADRSWERGLHQMIEAKEGLEITGRMETLARISYQRFFRRYLRLAGMTGTGREVASEIWAVYRLGVVRVPTNRPSRRSMAPDRIYATAEAKWATVVSRVAALHRAGRPVLVGTRSVAASEELGARLDAEGIPHRILNARQNREEAAIVAEAGGPGRVTVATNMAGRGTDIALADGVARDGGLVVVACERHDARRIDRQLFGRCGRQGDPGACEAVVSLEDELVRDFWRARAMGLAARLARADGTLPNWAGRPLFWLAQVATERRHGAIRRRLLLADESLEDMLAFAGRAE